MSTPSDAAGARRLSPLTPVVRAPIVVLAVIGGSWQQLLDQDGFGSLGFLILGLLAVGALYGVASWLLTRYWIDADELRIDTGVVFRQSRRIRIDRLQGVDIVQPLVARLFGLAELRFDVASSGEREGSLAFLPHGEALELRRLLLQRRENLRTTRPSGAPGAEGAAGAAPDSVAGPPQPERVLARLDLVRLVLSLALSTEMVWVLVGAASLVVTFVVTGSFAVAGGIVPAAAALAVALARRLTAYYGFTLSDSPEGLHVRRGLTALSSQTITLERIQGVVVKEPLLWRSAGWAKLEVSVAGYESSDADRAQASSTLMPVAPRDEVFALARHVLGRDAREVAMTAPPRRARWLAPLTAWTMALGQDSELLVSRRGFWARRLDVVPQVRVQSVRLRQGPVQRRLMLADVLVDSPPGPVQVRGELREPAEARAWTLRAVELGRRARARGRAQERVGATPPAPETTQ